MLKVILFVAVMYMIVTSGALPAMIAAGVLGSIMISKLGQKP